MASRKETFFLISGLLALFTVIILIPVETQEIPTMERNGWGSQQSGTQPHCAQTYYFYLEHDDGTRDKIGQTTLYCNI